MDISDAARPWPPLGSPAESAGFSPSRGFSCLHGTRGIAGICWNHLLRIHLKSPEIRNPKRQGAPFHIKKVVVAARVGRELDVNISGQV